MKYIKKYYPMVISIIFVTIYSFLLTAAFTNNINIINNNLNLMIVLMIITFLTVIGIWIEIIFFMIHAAKNKELKNRVLWAIMIYFFHIFIIPYYNLKYVIKEKKVSLQMVLFVILLILSIFEGIDLSTRYKRNTENNVNILYIDNYDRDVQFSFSGDYVKRNLGEYDIYASDYTRGINVGAFVYNKEEFTSIEVQNTKTNWIQNARNNVYRITTYSVELDDRSIVSETFYGESNNEGFAYQISTVEFKNTDDLVNVIQVCFYEDYETYKEEFKKILIDIKTIN